MKDGKAILILLVLFIFIMYVLRGVLGRISALFFVPIDSLLFVSHSIPPVAMWMFFGLLIGLIYGSFIAIKKFKLDFKLLGYPIAILVFSIALILLVSYLSNRGRSASTKDQTLKQMNGYSVQEKGIHV